MSLTVNGHIVLLQASSTCRSLTLRPELVSTRARATSHTKRLRLQRQQRQKLPKEKEKDRPKHRLLARDRPRSLLLKKKTGEPASGLTGNRKVHCFLRCS